MAKLVTKNIRIHPRSKNAKGGFRVDRYIIYGTLFTAEQNWYKCSFSEEQWDELAAIRTKNGDPDTKLVFDIATDDERKKINAREMQEKIMGTPAAEPVDLTTRDLRRSVSEEADRKRDDKLLEAESEGDIAPPVPTATPVRKPGRPKGSGRKVVVSATEG